MSPLLRALLIVMLGTGGALAGCGDSRRQGATPGSSTTPATGLSTMPGAHEAPPRQPGP